MTNYREILMYTPPQLPALHGQIAHPRRSLPTTDARKAKLLPLINRSAEMHRHYATYQSA